jgi:GNAT superfamily N-acetyltransferase
VLNAGLENINAVGGEMKIRPAAASDVPAILELIRALAVYEKLGHTVAASEDGLREALFGSRPVAEVLLACEYGAAGEECAGFALFFPNFSTFLGRPGLYLEDLFVKPEFRGRGIGRALLTSLARIARGRSYGRMEWSVLDWNTPAIGFYKRLGAIPMEEWTTMRLTGDALEQLAGEKGP